MTSASMAVPASGTGEEGQGKRAGALKWLIVALIVMLGAVLGGAFAVTEYRAATTAAVRGAANNATRFEAIFRDLVDARFRTLSLAADVLLQSRVTIEGFARNDRANLIQRIEPFFDNLTRNHGIEQLNFWTAPAVVYYRAGRPDEFGQDLSSVRPSIVAAIAKRERILAVETGSGGVVALRAIVPITVDSKFIGVIEFVSSFNIPLERASETTGLGWAVSLTKAVSDRSGRKPDPAVDSQQREDVYFRYSSPATGDLVRMISFDPRAKEPGLAEADGRTVFVKTFPVVNFSGNPTITIATVLELSKAFADALTGAVVKGAILFLAIAIGGSIAFIKFGEIKATLMGALGRQRKELEERIAFCDAAMVKLKDVDHVKRGFFSNLVTAVNDPLKTVSTQLRSVAAAGVPQDAASRLEFAINETARLSSLVEDYQAIEQFRLGLSATAAAPVALGPLVEQALTEDLDVYRRLPQLQIAATLPGDLPAVRADAERLRQAIADLVAFAAQRSGRGKITIGGRKDGQAVEIAITGTAFTGPGAPSEALLDESRQFLARLADGRSPKADRPMIGVVMARILVEFLGGSLDIAESKTAPGFLIRLPAAG